MTVLQAAALFWAALIVIWAWAEIKHNRRQRK